MAEICKNCKTDRDVCPFLGDDRLPVQCVGSWAEDKYYFLQSYLVLIVTFMQNPANNCKIDRELWRLLRPI